MEISMLGVGLQSTVFRQSSLLISSLTRASNSELSPVLVTLNGELVQANAGNRNTINFQKRSERQTAVLEVKQSSDLDLALSRVGEILTARDLNAILCHLGKLNRLQDISKLFLWMLDNRKLDASSYVSYLRFMGNKFDAAEMLDLYSCIQDESTTNNVYVILFSVI